MSKVLFINGCAHGHINPTLPLVKELVLRGEEVYYFSTKEFKEKIVSTGATFIDDGGQYSDFNQSFKPLGKHPFYNLIDYILRSGDAIVSIISEQIKNIKFDYIIRDSIFGGCNAMSKLLNIPEICSCTSFAMNRLPLPERMLQYGFHPDLDILFENIRSFAAKWKLDELTIMDVFFKKAELNIVYSSKEFQPEGDTFDESFRFVGPSIDIRKDEVDFPIESLNENKVIYISMGTINNNLIEFYKKCIQAFENTDYKIVISVGEKVDISQLGSLPENFLVKSYVPQLEVLEKTKVFISHGGMNSVSEALYYGVPIIAIPMVNDQHLVSKQIVQLGAGISLKMEEVTGELLKNSVAEVFTDSLYKDKSKSIGESLRCAGGYKAAADYIFEFKKNKI